MNGKNITLKELAQKFGVSISTISKALNDSHEIGDHTKRKIKELAKRYNYAPNKMALNLKYGKTNTIGVVLPSVQNYFFAQVLFGIESVIAKSSYNMIVSITHESFKKEVNNLKTLSNAIVDGFIIAVAEETQIKNDFNHFKQALVNNKVMVMFDRVVKNIDCDKVVVDDLDAVYYATNYLIKKGKKKIALVSTINNLSVGKLRTKGYSKAIKNAFKKLDKSLLIETTEDKVSASAEKLLSTNNIDAIIALDEDSSLAALKITKQRGFKIPDSITIIGYASEKTAYNLSPELTTIDQHGVKIGKTAARMLLDKLESNSKINKSIIIKSTLIERATS